jgi:hypothetical protein
MAAAMLAQLSSLAHEMTVRHFRCAEHGELTHVAALATSADAAGAQRTTDALRSSGGEASDAHEHCGVAFTVEGSSCTPSAGGAVGTVAPTPVAHPSRALVTPDGQAGVLASAPKTSPPGA